MLTNTSCHEISMDQASTSLGGRGFSMSALCDTGLFGWHRVQRPRAEKKKQRDMRQDGRSWAQHTHTHCETKTPAMRQRARSWAQHPHTGRCGRSWAQHPKWSNLVERGWAQRSGFSTVHSQVMKNMPFSLFVVDHEKGGIHPRVLGALSGVS